MFAVRYAAFAVLAYTLASGSVSAAPPAFSSAEAQSLVDRVGRPTLKQLLTDKGNAFDDFQQRRLYADDLGMVHQHVIQVQGGVPVWGSEAIIHLDRAGNVVTVTDDFLTRVNPKHVSLTPTLTSARAIDRALHQARFTSANLTSPATADLWIYRAKDGDHLAWRVQLPRTDGTEHTSLRVIFVDAHSGAPLWSYDNLQTGIGISLYSGAVALNTINTGAGFYELTDGTRGNQQTLSLNGSYGGTSTLFTDADDVWGNGTTSDPATAAVDAQYGASMTWDYYKNVQGRNGIRNDGASAPSRVHYGSSYVNAFWSDSCFCMTYGDGSGNARPLTSLDVAGHEMTHGVTSSTAGLIYYGESGGLNEATSDIMGTAVEFYANNAYDVGDYLIGEKIDIFGNGMPLRYMDKPSKDGWSVDCWSSSVSGLDPHYSSGVANHFFYLLSEGSGTQWINGVSYDSPTCNGSFVTGITRAKAERIWYRALTTYMTASTNYAAARTATLNAAEDLYGIGSIEQNAVAAAWSAVNVGVNGALLPAPLTNAVPVSNLSGVYAQQLTFSLAVPAGATSLTFTIAGGAGDADLYVQFGSAPTLASFDCRPYLDGNSETCTFTNPAAGTWYVMLNGWAAFAGVTLTGTYSPIRLRNGIPASNLSGAYAQQLTYSLSVPAGQTMLSFTTSGGSGDVDLYVKFGSAPTLTSFDCRPYLDGNNETCNFSNPTAGTWYVMLNGWAAFSGVSLMGQYAGSLANGGLEGSSSPWMLSGNGGQGAFYVASGPTPRSGVGYVYLGASDNVSAALTQSFTVPVSGNTLRFWLAVTSNEPPTTIPWDQLSVEVLSSSGAVLGTLAIYSNLDQTPLVSYAQRGGFSLAPWAGQNIRLRFRATTDIIYSTTFYIDDVTVN